MTGRLSLMGKTALFQLLLISAFIKLSGCMNIDTKDKSDNTFRHNCMDINGTVLGRLQPDSRVHLFQMERLDYPDVMNAIRAAVPTASAFLSTNQHFFFHCVSPGRYVLAIPVSSYNFSCGSPIPEERQQNNLSVRVIYQGGDSGYMVAAFAIE
jgi:hypothetical protein